MQKKQWVVGEVPRLSGYDPVRPLRQGGQGAIWVVRERVGGALRVLKIFSAQFDPRAAEECRVLLALDVDGVARVRRHGRIRSEAGAEFECFVSDYIASAQSVTRYADAHHLPVPARLRLFARAADILQRVHDRNVFHRDLKPSHILVRRGVNLGDDADNAEPWLIDFGMALSLASSAPNRSDITMVGEASGTPEYMAPEVLRSGIRHCKHDGDVYSLGVVLFELLTGTLPYDAPVGGEDDDVRWQAAISYATGCYHARPAERLRRAERPPRLAADETAQTEALVELDGLLGAELGSLLLYSIHESPADVRYRAAQQLAEEARRCADWVERREGHPLRRGVAAHHLWLRSEATNAVERYGDLLAGTTSLVREGKFTSAANVLDQVPSSQRSSWDFRFYNRCARPELLRLPALGSATMSEQGDLVAVANKGILEMWGLSPALNCERRWAVSCEAKAVLFDRPRSELICSEGTKVVFRSLLTGERVVDDLRLDWQVTAIAFDRTCSYLAIGTAHGEVVVRNLAARTPAGEVKTSGFVSGLAFSEDLTLLCASSFDPSRVSLWDFPSLKSCTEGGQSSEALIGIAVARNGQRCLSVDCGALHVLRMPDLAHVRSIKAPNGAVFGRLTKPADTNEAFTTAGDAVVAVRLSGRSPTRRIAVEPDVMSVSLPAGGRIITTSTSEGQVRIWDPGQPHSPRHSLCEREGYTMAAFDPGSTAVAAVTEDGTVRTWRADGTPLWSASGLRDVRGRTRLLSARFSPDGCLIVVAGWDGSIWVWDVLTGSLRGTWLLHRREVYNAEYDPSGMTILTACKGGAVVVWDANRLTPVGDAIAEHGLRGLARFSPRGDWVAYLDRDYAAVVVDLKSRRVVGKTRGAREFATYLVYSPQGDRLLITHSGYVQVWCAERFEPIGPPLACDATVRWADFSPDGKRIVTCTSTGSRLWCGETFLPIGTALNELPSSPVSAEFSRDGTRLLFAFSDNGVQVWDSRPARQIFNEKTLTIPKDEDRLASATAARGWAQTIVHAARARGIGIEEALHEVDALDAVGGELTKARVKEMIRQRWVP